MRATRDAKKAGSRSINGGIIDHKAPRERRFGAVQNGARSGGSTDNSAEHVAGFIVGVCDGGAVAVIDKREAAGRIVGVVDRRSERYQKQSQKKPESVGVHSYSF